MKIWCSPKMSEIPDKLQDAKSSFEYEMRRKSFYDNKDGKAGYVLILLFLLTLSFLPS